MKKLLLIMTVAVFAGIVAACHDDEAQTTWDTFADWRELNDAWVKEMQERRNPDGSPYYRQLVPEWNPAAFVLIHYFNDRALTDGNLSPLYTSVVDVRYVGRDCKGEGFDSSTLVNRYGRPGIQRFACNSVIQGWSIALQDMRVGDTCEIIVPYGAGYGASTAGSILPYSALRFNLRLDDIYLYEAAQ